MGKQFVCMHVLFFGGVYCHYPYMCIFCVKIYSLFDYMVVRYVTYCALEVLHSICIGWYWFVVLLSASLLFLWYGNVREEVSCKYNARLSFWKSFCFFTCIDLKKIYNIIANITIM